MCAHLAYAFGWSQKCSALNITVFNGETLLYRLSKHTMCFIACQRYDAVYLGSSRFICKSIASHIRTVIFQCGPPQQCYCCGGGTYQKQRNRKWSKNDSIGVCVFSIREWCAQVLANGTEGNKPNETGEIVKWRFRATNSSPHRATYRTLWPQRSCVSPFQNDALKSIQAMKQVNQIDRAVQWHFTLGTPNYR